MPHPHPVTGRRRLGLLLALLAVVAAVALIDPLSDGESPRGVSVQRQSTGSTAQQRVVSDADRAYADTLVQQWLGPQRWAVSPGSDSSIALTEAALTDSTVADVMQAFVMIGALRDSSSRIELAGGPRSGRAALVGNIDSLVAHAVRERMNGCPLAVGMPVRFDAPRVEWYAGFVPGMVTDVPRITVVDARQRAEGTRLLATLSDSTLSTEVLDSLRGARWSDVDITLWRTDDDGELLVASRRRQHPAGEYAHYVQEQHVIAERQSGQPAFRSVYERHTAYDTDETASMWVDGALRVGPQKRFALQLGFGGKEGTAGSLLIRTNGKWREAVQWSSGC